MGGLTALSDWDIDFRRGKVGENLLEDIVETSEVKTDYRWQETGNVYIEFECWYNASQTWKDSGISVSKAKYYTLVLPIGDNEPLVVSVPTQLLKEVVQEKGRYIECVISQNPSKGHLIRVSDIMEIYLGTRT
tara:strand:- start:838 stop:1236 length:399 start_codon:yes stop_codon:yes gene_type:complete